MTGPKIKDTWGLAQNAWPELRDAAPMVPHVATGDVVDVANLPPEILKLDDVTYRRRLLPSATGLVGPVYLRGQCLEPLLSGEEALWFDPKTSAEDGDFVLVSIERDFIEETIGRLSQNELERHAGAMLETLLVKQLRYFNGWPYLVATGGALDLSIPTQIRGVLRHVMRYKRTKVSLDQLRAALSSSRVLPEG